MPGINNRLTNASGPRLWLAAEDGKLLPQLESVAPIDAPETILVVEFEGLTEAEQRAALSAFPGGKRFELASTRH